MRKHGDFLGRLTKDGFRPVPPLRVFDVVRYQREDQPLERPFRVFELRTLDGARFRYPHRKLIHIAGMIRHLVIQAAKKDPPVGVSDDWVETFVAGHAAENSREHRQLSYLPLPSIGKAHTDPGVRRVMIAAPIGDHGWLDHIARRLAGQVLRPDSSKPDPFGGREPPLLVPVSPKARDGVVSSYTKEASEWHSVTPVVLPGHNDHKPEKTCALIEKALRQSGVHFSCDYEWSAFSRFPKSYSAYKYATNKQPQGYIRPNHLQSQTAVHLTLRFHDGSAERRPVKVPGPMVVGAGRHCGFGLFAAVNE
jgi:CRISPR-associated protein Csb2